MHLQSYLYTKYVVCTWSVVYVSYGSLCANPYSVFRTSYSVFPVPYYLFNVFHFLFLIRYSVVPGFEFRCAVISFQRQNVF